MGIQQAIELLNKRSNEAANGSLVKLLGSLT
jgi:hypothetical protein